MKRNTSRFVQDLNLNDQFHFLKLTISEPQVKVNSNNTKAGHKSKQDKRRKGKKTKRVEQKIKQKK